MKKDKHTYKTMDEVREIIKNRPKPPIINEHLSNKIEQIVNDLVILHARDEAILLLNLANKEEISNFLYYHYSRSQVALCVIDTIKDRLVSEGLTICRPEDSFGLLTHPKHK